MKRAVAVVFRDGWWRLGAVDEGVPGYWPLDALSRWDTADAAQLAADELNTLMGLTPSTAAAIAASALEAGPVRRDLPLEAQR